MDQVGYPVMAVKNYPHVAVGIRVAPTQLREALKKLNSLLDAFNSP